MSNFASIKEITYHFCKSSQIHFVPQASVPHAELLVSGIRSTPYASVTDCSTRDSGPEQTVPHGTTWYHMVPGCRRETQSLPMTQWGAGGAAAHHGLPSEDSSPCAPLVPQPRRNRGAKGRAAIGPQLSPPPSRPPPNLSLPAPSSVPTTPGPRLPSAPAPLLLGPHVTCPHPSPHKLHIHSTPCT